MSPLSMTCKGSQRLLGSQFAATDGNAVAPRMPHGEPPS